MFTGIITHTGVFREFREGRDVLVMDAPGLGGRLGPGDSLAVDGVCLTLIGREDDRLRFNVSRETLAKTTLGRLRPGARLNLELPLTLGSYVGGHLVTGHVDDAVKALRAVARGPGKRLVIAAPASVRPFLAPQGSVAVSGVSLTVAALDADSFAVELIPATLAATNLGEIRGGSLVNLECDILGKYVYNWLSRSKDRI